MMKDYYDLLELPLTASPDEIKAKYRQLVRIYHPDRFTNQTDKSYAEQKLKQLNEAYAALTTTGRGAPRPVDARPPIPIVEPAVIDFGLVPPHHRRRARVQVGNVGGVAQNVAFTYSEEPHWFTITKGRQIYADQPMPLEFEVAVNTAELEPNHQYQGWVEINMDGITARIALQLAVGEPSAPTVAPRRLVIGGLLALLTLALIVVIPLLWSYGLALEPNELAPPVPTHSAAAPVGANPAGEGVVSAWSAIFSPDGRQIAFLSDQLGGIQLFLRDPQSGRLRQLTNSPEGKSAVAWSPDSNLLAYIARDESASVVQVINITTSAVQTFAPIQPGLVQRFVWSPDGQALRFEVATAGVTQVYQANLDDATPQLVDQPVEW
jgi:hypothetical protein